jgi:coenzyme F420-reducing hydrogenase alpha subunit
LGEGADVGISQAALLPPLWRLEDDVARDLAQRALDVPAFCAQPLWCGAPAETGAVARLSEQPLLAAWIAQRGRGAGARLLARLLELAALPTRLSACLPDTGAALVRAWSLGDNIGLAGVETSRGLLLHVVRLRQGKVAEYRIVAPTEWNFHPDGPLAQALSGLAPGADLAVRAQLVAQSLDPCVAFGIEVCDA